MNNDVLLILGNGFDLNLGLKTSYADFIKDTFDINKECEDDLCNYMVEVFKEGDKNWIDIENELKEYSGLLTKNYPKDTGTVDISYSFMISELTSSLFWLENTVLLS